MFSSISQALKFLKQTIFEWANVRRQLETRLYEIATLIRSHQSSSKNQEAIGKLIVLKTQTQQSLKEYNDFSIKLGPFTEWLESNTIGAFPIFIIAGSVGLASALYLFLEKVKNEGKALDLIKQGLLKPEQAKALLTGGGLSDTLGNVNTMLMLGLGAYVLFMFGPMLFKKG